MPFRPRTPCAWPGCTKLVRARHCDGHATVYGQTIAERHAQTRREHHKVYNARWRKLRQVKLNDDPFCQACEQAGRWEAATVVDHITPHRGDATLAYDWSNLQSMCKPCHDRKTALEVGFAGRHDQHRARE